MDIRTPRESLWVSLYRLSFCPLGGISYYDYFNIVSEFQELW